MLAAGEFDAVDGGARFDGWVVGRGEGAGEEGVEEGGFAGSRTTENVSEEDVALDAGRIAVGIALAGFCKFEGGGRGGRVGGWGLEAEVGEVGEGGFGGGKGGHAPLGQPALQGNVAGFVADGGAGEGGVEPLRGEAGGWGEEGRKFRGVEAAVVVGVGEEEKIDEEAVAGWGELGGGVRGYVEFGVEEGIAEGEGVGVVEGAEDDPYRFMAAFFREDFVQENEAGLGNAFAGYGRGGVFANGLFDVLEVVVSQRFAEAFGLEVLHLFVTQVAIMIPVGQVEDPLQRCDARGLQSRLLRVE